MEINGEDGSKLRLESGEQTHLGRGNGFNPTDRTVSRHHVSFQLVNSDDEIRVHFQVLGKNPIWVHFNKNDEIKTFRFLENGELDSGDMFCVSGKKPIWFALRRLELDDGSGELGLESQLGESLNVEELDVESVDVSGFDPVKEFDFVVMGHEFDCYPKKMIRDIKNWDWFIDQPGEEGSENDEVGASKRKGGGRRKRKNSGGVEDDDEWTGESDEDKEVLPKSSKVKRPKYSTRSKGSDRPVKAAKIGSNSRQIEDEEDDEGEDEDEDDETLGGFIVDEDSAGEELENDDEEDEEEEEEEFEEDEEEE
ncbi:mitotic apparatus protein p62 [Heracleum sosnowskyi]|uniref:Mitotic apparatus protein p62 n=1 Tax=Heracleum sosnowskyi TaxID=360622 RepID=A0AAD8H547_9APIA|nr:mitotic apparatus protein p62 [Heracleum sosnowskyi]